MIDEYALEIVTPPAKEPVTLAEMKDFLRVDEVGDDTLINALIGAAREAVEIWLGRQLITADYDLFLDRFPPGGGDRLRLGPHVEPRFGGLIRFPKPPLQSVTTIKHFDEDGVLQTIPNTDYIVDTASIQGRVTPTPETFWPITDVRINAVEIRFKAGFGDDETDVPEAIRAAIMLLTADLYEHRESQSEIALRENQTVKRLIWTHKVPRAA